MLDLIVLLRSGSAKKKTSLASSFCIDENKMSVVFDARDDAQVRLGRALKDGRQQHLNRIRLPSTY